MTASWAERVAGVDCPFDGLLPERDQERYLVRRLQASSLYLDCNQGYTGHCILIFDRRHATRIDELTPAEWQTLANDLRASCAAIMAALKPDHLNVESLGNVVPHLHWHIFPRSQDDPRWGSAVWTSDTADMPVRRLTEQEYAALAGRISKALDNHDVDGR